MAIPTPQTRWRRFWASDVPWDILSAVAGLGSGVVSAYRFFQIDPSVDPQAATWGWIALGGAGIALLSQLAKVGKKWAQDSKQKAVHDLAGCLHAINAVLLADADQKAVGLRATVHVPVPGSKEELVQVLDYVGDQRKKNTQGRRMPVNVGAIGKAYREQAANCASRTTENHEDFVRQMVTSYSFSPDQARKLDASTMSWMAVPLMNTSSGEVLGVLYCDAKVRDYFNEERQRVVIFAAVGIAYFVGVRYS